MSISDGPGRPPDTAGRQGAAGFGLRPAGGLAPAPARPTRRLVAPRRRTQARAALSVRAAGPRASARDIERRLERLRARRIATLERHAILRRERRRTGRRATPEFRATPRRDGAPRRIRGWHGQSLRHVPRTACGARRTAFSPTLTRTTRAERFAGRKTTRLNHAQVERTRDRRTPSPGRARRARRRAYPTARTMAPRKIRVAHPRKSARPRRAERRRTHDSPRGS